MRIIARHPEGTAVRLTRSPENDARLVQYLTQEIEDALSARATWDEAVGEWLRQYHGVPKTPYRSVPIENAPNIEVTLGAINVDAIYAQASELIFSASPILTVRAMRAPYQEDAKALQKFVNWSVPNEMQLRAAADQVLLDDCQLGTGIYYTPWVDLVKKTDVAEVKESGPRILPVPPEDFITPGGAYADLQQMPWVAMRTWLREDELAARAKAENLKVKRFGAASALSDVRERRESLGRTTSNAKLAKCYEVFDVYVRFDYDQDGIPEDLLCIWDRTSKRIGWLNYQPYDWRPFAGMRYQLRPYLWPGIGIMEMIQPYQEEVTEAHNARAANVILANCRMYKTRTGNVQYGPDGAFPIYAGKINEMNDPAAFEELRISDIYPSAIVNEQATIALAQQRVGNTASETAQPISTSRTPGVTAVSLMQQKNRRFTAAFDQMRLATAEAVLQGCYRYRERLLAGDRRAEENILRVMGASDGPRVIALFRAEGFEENIAVELTASSASINREADRQNALMLANLYGQYYQQALQTLAIAANPQTPEAVRKAAEKMSAKGHELMDMVSRAFELIARDPSVVLLDLAPEYALIEQQQQQGGPLEQLIQRFAQTQGGNGGGPSPDGMPGPAVPLPNSGSGSV